MLVRIALARIIIKENGDQSILLREVGGDQAFPVMIGLPEALAIDRRIKGQKQSRPLTHDLLHSVIQQLGGELERIVINELKDHTYYAKLYIRQNGAIVEIDARPSDAIALGAGSDTPMYVSQSVLDELG